MLLDETAQDLLKPNEGNAELIAKSLKLEDTVRAKSKEADTYLRNIKELISECEKLRNELSGRDGKIASLEHELSDEKAKTAGMEKRIIELTDKTSAFENFAERLNALLGVLEETANTGVGKKLGSLLTGRH